MIKKILLLAFVLPNVSFAAPTQTPVTMEQVIQSVNTATKGFDTYCSVITGSHAKITHCFRKQSLQAEQHISEMEKIVGHSTLWNDPKFLAAIEAKQDTRRRLINLVESSTNQVALRKKYWPNNVTNAQITSNPMCSAIKTAYTKAETCRPLKNMVAKKTCVWDVLLPLMVTIENAGGKPPARHRKRFKTLCHEEQLALRIHDVLHGGP